MLNRWIQTSSPIGCEIGVDRLRLSQVQGSGAAARLVAQVADLPAGLADAQPGYAATLSDLLRRMLHAGSFTGRRCVSCLPGHKLMYRMMRLAPMPDAELLQAAHWKVASELNLKADSFKTELLQLGQTHEGDKARIEVAAIAVENSALEQHVQILTGAGLQPWAIDASACAVVRCLEQLVAAGDAAGQALVLELNATSATLAVSGNGGLVFIRPVGEGVTFTHQLMADMLGIKLPAAAQLHALLSRPGAGEDPESIPNWPCAQIEPARARKMMIDAEMIYARDLARDLALSLHYLTGTLGNSFPASGIVTGPGALSAQTLEQISAQTGITLVRDLPLRHPAWEQALRQVDAHATLCDWTTVLGLALYEQIQPAREVA